jgi:hypothetical protein
MRVMAGLEDSYKHHKKLNEPTVFEVWKTGQGNESTFHAFVNFYSLGNGNPMLSSSVEELARRVKTCFIFYDTPGQKKGEFNFINLPDESTPTKRLTGYEQETLLEIIDPPKEGTASPSAFRNARRIIESYNKKPADQKETGFSF